MDLSFISVSSLLDDSYIYSLASISMLLVLTSFLLPGGVPDLTHMPVLEKLNVSSNQLSGSLPASVGDLTSLRLLDISFNSKMTGTLPSSASKLTHLTELNIQMTDTGPPDSSGSGVAIKKKTILRKLPSLSNISM